MVVDSCFSGTLFVRSTTPPPGAADLPYFKRVYRLKSRQGLTSGNIEPVTDEGYGGHSIFACYFLKALKENQDSYLVPSTLFERIKTPIARNALQTPINKPLAMVGDEGGEFVFALRGSAAQPTRHRVDVDTYKYMADLSEAYAEVKKMDGIDTLPSRLKIQAWKKFLADFPRDNFLAKEARQRIAHWEADEKRLAGEQARQEEERRRREEQQRLEAERKAAEERAKIEENSRKLEKEKARLKAEHRRQEEARRKAEEEARLAAARKSAEEKARLEAERRKQELERKKREEEAQRQEMATVRPPEKPGPPKCSLRVEANVEGARVYIQRGEKKGWFFSRPNWVLVGDAPLVIEELAPGKHNIKVEALGYEEYEDLDDTVRPG